MRELVAFREMSSWSAMSWAVMRWPVMDENQFLYRSALVMTPILVTTFIVSKWGLTRGNDKSDAPVVIPVLSYGRPMT